MPQQVWKANDGQIFDSEKECVLYEYTKDQLTVIGNYAIDEDWDMHEGFFDLLYDSWDPETWWRYAKSFRTLVDILDGKRPDLPKKK